MELATPGEGSRGWRHRMKGRGDATTRRVLCAEARGLRNASVDAAHSATTKERQLDSFRTQFAVAYERMCDVEQVRRPSRVLSPSVYGIKLSEACLAPPRHPWKLQKVKLRVPGHRCCNAG